MASVRMFKYDIDNFGSIKPETRQRVYDEELSLFVEGVDRAATTSFTLNRDKNGNLIYFNQGEWQPYVTTLLTGLDVAEKEAQADPRRKFLARKAHEDLQVGVKLNELKPGEQLVWYSAYPKNEENMFGKKFLRERGFLTEREAGFIYLATANQDDSLTLESQIVDKSDEDGFSKVMEQIEYYDEVDIDVLTNLYDSVLFEKTGTFHFAGKKYGHKGENAWQEIQKHRDIIETHLNKLEIFAKMGGASHVLEPMLKQHTYGVWATFKARLNQQPATSGDNVIYYEQPRYANVEQEIYANLINFASRGEQMVGCGGSISIDTLMSADSKDVFDSMFGQSKTRESYSFNKNMYCVVCQAPPKKNESKKMCGPCGLCRSCDINAGGSG